MLAEVATLDDRAVIAVEGTEARGFLQRLVTNDVEGLSAGTARYAALLTPQGKIMTDFLIAAQSDGAGFFLDTPAGTAADLVKKLSLYRLRAKITIVDRSETLGIVAFASPTPPCPVVLAYADPRAAGLWARAIVEKTSCVDQGGEAGREAYQEQRIRAGVPEGGVDFVYGETFPHDANLDHMAGVDFTKGCYVGQEVVSRVQHRGTARKRIVVAEFDGPAPAAGADIVAGDLAIGTMGSSIPGLGLGLVRLDRAAETTDPLTAAGVTLRLKLPPWASARSNANG